MLPPENALATSMFEAPGRALVRPRRAVSSWRALTPEERAAVAELLVEVEQALLAAIPGARVEARFDLDPGNPGEGAGDAGAETFGVRLYAGPPASPGSHLTVGGPADPLIRRLRPLFERATEVAIVAAFVQESGLHRLHALVEGALSRGARIRILTGDYLHITQAAALEHLLDWIASAPAGEDESGAFEARVVEVEKLAHPTSSFHPKSWRFEGPGLAALFVGSSNVSRAALETGIEWNLRLDEVADPLTYRRAVEAFDATWAEARLLDARYVSAYAAQAQLQSRALPPGDGEAEAPEAVPEPNAHQAAALEKLRTARARGVRRGLVVLATGVGKTWLSAFDVRELGRAQGRLPRVLFVAHRQEILRQAARTFRALVRAEAPGRTITWFAGSATDLSGDLVFASVQKLTRSEHLEALDPAAFDYVIVDEVHHAAAPTYRRLLDHVAPAFVLGLTATPERADEGSILDLFDDNLLHRVDLGEGIATGHLVPFSYFGLRDDVDYASIPWRNRRFDPEALARAVQTERRMVKMWEAWTQHGGSRTLVFCASVAHANFVRGWLRDRGVRADAIHTGDGADDREASLDALRAGALDAVCAVDVLNEGIDVPSVDRVVMLRPTESPLVFLQQLGRGLRFLAGKPPLTVIDFVGNHRMFLERVRRLLTLGGADPGEGLPALLRSAGTVELPFGCSVDLELEAKDFLRSLLPPGGVELRGVYRQLRDGRGTRPTAGELQRMGYNVAPLVGKAGYASWLDFVHAEGDLSEEEAEALGRARPLYVHVEQARLKAGALELLRAFVEAGGRAVPRRALRARFERVLARSTGGEEELDFEGSLAAWVRPSSGRAWLREQGDAVELGTSFDTSAGLDLLRELVDLRVAKARTAPLPGSVFACKVVWNKRDPILRLDRERFPDIPRDDYDVRLPDGRVWVFRFKKAFCNVARPAGTDRNRLPDLLRSWFGPSAGQPGTEFRVDFRPTPDGLWAEPRGQLVALADRRASRRGVPAYPDLRAAAGAPASGQSGLEVDEVTLPVDPSASEVFAVRAAGRSMDGGSQPIREGDWVVAKFSRGDPLSALEGRVGLVQVPDVDGTFSYLLKRVVRGDAGWTLRSDHPEIADLPAPPESVAIARLVDVISPERLGPEPGATLDEEQLAEAFGLGSRPETGRTEGHLFFFIDRPGMLEAPDRLRTGLSARPGETAFILARIDEGRWRYCGVGHPAESPGGWTVPHLDFTLYRKWGAGRSASRTLPEVYLERARTLVERIEAEVSPGALFEARGKRGRVLGRAKKGGLRIDGGASGAKERTVSLVDLGWVLRAEDDVRAKGGLLDEERVNRLRYLDGTPKGSTRYIDTGWAIALVASRG